MNKLNKFMLVLAVVMLGAFSNQANAQEKAAPISTDIPPAIVGVIDFVQIEKEATIYQSYIKQKIAEDTKLKARKKAMETELNKKGEEIEKQKNLVSKEAFDKMVGEYKALAKKYDLELRGKTEAYLKAIEASIITLNRATLSATEEISSSKNINLVLPRKSTVFFLPAMNITDDVIAIMNKKSTKITFNPEAKK